MVRESGNQFHRAPAPVGAWAPCKPDNLIRGRSGTPAALANLRGQGGTLFPPWSLTDGPVDPGQARAPIIPR